MGERRFSRGLPPRTDRQILEHMDDVDMLRAIAAGQVTVTVDNRMQLKRLAREDLCLGGFGTGVGVALLPRGQQILASARGELPSPLDY